MIDSNPKSRQTKNDPRKEFFDQLHANDNHANNVIRRLVANLTFNKAESVALYQEIIAVGLKAFPGWKRKGTFVSWMTTIARRVVIRKGCNEGQEMRMRANIAERLAATPSATMDTQFPEDRMLHAEKVAFCNQLLDKLPELTMYCFIFNKILHMTYQDVADYFDITKSEATRHVNTTAQEIALYCLLTKCYASEN